MIEYRQAKPEEYEKCLNFGNYVFSQAHCPHDFSKLLPKAYKDADAFSAVPHFIAIRDDGEIRGLVALRDTPLMFNGNTLSCGFVGTVSVHPYARSEGHMKANMAAMLEYSGQKNYDMLILGGQRQRYNYFGFERGGVAMVYSISATNLRHKYRDVDAEGITFAELTEENGADYAYSLYEKQSTRGIRTRSAFTDTLRSWTSTPYMVYDKGTPIGYFVSGGREILLEDEADLPRVIKAYFAFTSCDKLRVTCGIHEAKRMQLLGDLAESVSVDSCEMINVLNWKNVLGTLLRYKAAFTRIEDGEKTFVIENNAYTIKVTDGEPEVTEGGNTEGAPELGHLEAQNLFFGMNALVNPPAGIPFGWTAIPFFMNSTDGF